MTLKDFVSRISSTQKLIVFNSSCSILFYHCTCSELSYLIRLHFPNKIDDIVNCGIRFISFIDGVCEIELVESF